MTINLDSIAFDAVLSAFDVMSSRTRLAIVMVLYSGEKHVKAIEDELGESQPNTSMNLRELRLVGVVDNRRDGKRIYYSLTKKGRSYAETAKFLASY